jgi:ABC-type Mn/Zn transport systems, ATPase component
MKAIEVSNLNFSYGNNKIISNLSFEIEEGDFVCIIGLNGAGKSTLLKLMLNILLPDSGTININKKNSADISYVAQNAVHFNPNFPATVKEIVGLGINSTNIFANNNKKILDALEKVGMSDYLNRKIGKLSGGQQQRIILAKALVNNPKYIFLDEPTTGIDNEAVQSICCLLGELNKKYKITIVMVTHDIFSIMNHATKIINFGEDGKIKIIPASNFNFDMFHHKCFYK